MAERYAPYSQKTHDARTAAKPKVKQAGGIDSLSSKKLNYADTKDANSLRKEVNAVDKKLNELSEKSPNKDEIFLVTSPGPHPGSPTVKGEDPPPWAHKLFSVLKGIKDDIANLRSDIFALQNKLPVNPNTDSNLSSSAHQPNPAPLQPPPMECDPTDDETDHSQTSLPPHASLLHECFQKRIGLAPTVRNEVDITTFDNVIVAKGYNRILPTWQGYYIELEKDDLVWANLQPNESPAYGEESWVSPGLTVFTRLRPDTRCTPRPHRFALKTPTNYTKPCNPLQPYKWYIHAYQARFLVDNYSRSLNSRTIASNLKELFPDRYHPRDKDLTNNPHPYVANEPQQTTTNQMPQPQTAPNISAFTTAPTPHPSSVPTPFLPMPNLPAPYLPPGIIIPTGYVPPAPLLKEQRRNGPTNRASHQSIPQQQFSYPTYAQVANPYYPHKMLPQPMPHLPHANLGYYPPTIQPGGQLAQPWNSHRQPAPPPA